MFEHLLILYIEIPILLRLCYYCFSLRVTRDFPYKTNKRAFLLNQTLDEFEHAYLLIDRRVGAIVTKYFVFGSSSKNLPLEDIQDRIPQQRESGVIRNFAESEDFPQNGDNYKCFAKGDRPKETCRVGSAELKESDN